MSKQTVRQFLPGGLTNFSHFFRPGDVMKKMPTNGGRKRTYNYTYIRELFQERRNYNPGYTKAELARELGLSTRTIRGILNGTYERHYLTIKSKGITLDAEEEEQYDCSGTLMVAWT